MPASRVVGSAVSQQLTSGTGTIAAPTNVTAGNCLLIGTVNFLAAGGAVAPTITKASGTATIGTPRIDGSVAAITSLGNKLLLAIISLPLTGSGSLTLQFTGGIDNCTYGWDEITGLDAIPVKDTSWSNFGTGNAYSTGPGTVAGAGIIVAGFCENSGSNPAYSAYSDTLVWGQNNSSFATGTQEEKITAGPGSNTLTVSNGTSMDWQGLAVSYLNAPSAARKVICAENNKRLLLQNNQYLLLN